MAERKYILYLSTNLLDTRTYTGIHLNKKLDPYEFDGYFGSNKELKADIKKLGKENFKRETLFVFDTKQEVKDKERELVPTEVVNDPNTYNKIVGGGGWPVLFGSDNPNYGKTFSVETCEALSKSHKGVIVSEETKQKMSIAHKDKKLSIDHCKKIRKGLQKYYTTPAGEVTREKARKTSTGKRHTKETREKIRKNHKGMSGKQHTKESKQLMSELKSGENHYNWGKHLSEETRKKMSKSHKLPPKIVGQRREDIKNIEKVRGWKSALGRKWNKGLPAVWAFINNYALDLV